MEEKVLATIRKYEMVQSGQKVLLSVSGGCDSLALFQLFLKFQPILELKLHIFHLNHQLRKEAKEDAAFVRKLAEKEKISCSIVTFDVSSFVKEHNLSLQEGARKIRYQLLEEEAERIKADRIALGHQANDQAETILMWILRGGGMEGLAGIPPVRGKYIRPLIETKRSELEDYCQKQGLKPRLDLSNFNLTYKRNLIRFELIPYLIKKYQPQLVEVLSRTGQILADENSLILELTETQFVNIAKEQNGEVKLYLPSFLMLPQAVKRRLLRKVIGIVKGDLKGVEFRHIESIINYVKPNQLQVLDLPPKVKVFREYDYLVVTTRREVYRGLEPKELHVPGCTKIKDLGLEIYASLTENQQKIETRPEPNIAFLDFNKLSFPLVIRYRKQGDVFQPLGMKSIKKLQDFFVDKKVPKRERDRIPLVESGDQIVWVVGYRIDERFKVTPQTQKILRLEARRED